MLQNDLLSDMYKVLKQTDNKKNTLYLQRSYNAGKTYLTKMMIPIDSIAGYHTTSREFPFCDAVYAPIILINELTIESAAKSELYKNVLGGKPTQINIKNKPSQIMARKPVVLTTNTNIWKTTSTQTSPPEKMEVDQSTQTDDILPTYTTCYGCSINHPSQTQHMDLGGCLYTEESITEEPTPPSKYQPIVEDITPDMTPDSATDEQMIKHQTDRQTTLSTPSESNI
ncbi:hypothetical protein ACF0H5_005459 [Mactra antiquata]